MRPGRADDGVHPMNRALPHRARAPANGTAHQEPGTGLRGPASSAATEAWPGAET